MSVIAKEKTDLKNNRLERFLNKVEIVGNKLPDPVTLFVILCISVLFISYIAGGVEVINPATGESVKVVNLLSKPELQRVLMEYVPKFQAFPPLGMVVVVTLGAGVAEKSGLLSAAMKTSINKVPKSMVTAAVILISILSDGAGDSGFVLLPPLAAATFLSIGRHPLVGMFAAYAAVCGGFSANLIVNMTDVLVASFTIPAAKMVDPAYNGTPAMNIYFMILSTVILTVLGVYITEKIVAPRFEKDNKKFNKESNESLSEIESKGLKLAGISVVIMIAVLIALCIGENAFMRDPVSGSLIAWESPLMQGLIPIITLMFLIPGLIYGKIVGKIKSDKDAVAMMGDAMKDMSSFLVIACFASLFIALFNWSNLGIVMAVRGTEFLKNSGLPGIWVLVGFIVLEAFINIFIGSASAKWAIMAPIFVPMLMFLGYSPAVTQMAFRIGDSITNPLSPLGAFFPMMLVLMKKYDKEAGMGTIISNMLPYTLLFGIVWTVMLVVFVALNIPLGPGGEIFYILK